MKPTLRTKGKQLLSKLLPDSNKLRYLSYLPKLESFRKNHSEKLPIFKDRPTMYQHINNEILENRPIVYCEFGVYKGGTIEKWANLNADKDSSFYGFDTFTGLPETWVNFTGSMEKNAFDVGGDIPKSDDARISYIKGLFQETLPGFLKDYDNNQQLVIHNDSDLYSSTLYVLTYADKIIVPGTIIIFDEYSSMLNEFRALEDYSSSYMRDYEVIAATVSSEGYYYQVAIKIL